ncbi:hypothetical protein [Dethiosulfatarculus sandiegensis]|uniref:Uncharacterized protein n=1 Tax=Dethiosulfatarculus sandiegensis TaxID=1429043 RepID=A0A0D2GGC4_9BACT|nr:hypothetical protein [Dethiosulfatarculus sandiegensis]KIX13952.1 hypothetical protein X474_12515 [Dethiosulfatarculus sandiegensis]
MKLTLAHRLRLAFGVCMTITAALGFIAFMAQRNTTQDFSKLIDQKVSFLIPADDIEIKMLQHRRYENKNKELGADLNNLKKFS